VWRAKDPVTGEEIIEEGDQRRYVEARLGDSLICPFECDDCVFYRLHHRWPTWEAPNDKYIGAFIRRANLDMFWAREPSTVSQNFREFLEQAKVGQDFNYLAFEPMGPFPRTYDSGMRAAIGVLMKTQRPGRHEAKMKFSAARKGRSIHTNMFKASARGCECSLYLRTDKKRSIASLSPTDSEFYTLFTKGLESRIGQRVKRDMAISIELMIELQSMAEDDWSEAVVQADAERQFETAQWACYFLYAFCHSLRGWEVVQATLTGLRSQFVDERRAQELGTTEHLGLPLYGRFKSCGNANASLLCMIAGTTASGLKPGKWTRRLLDTFEAREVRSDWVFQRRDGGKKRMTEFNDTFYDALLDIQARRPDMLDPDLDVLDAYFLARSFRRGATTRAQVAGVSEETVEWINRWGTGQEILVKGPMRIIYSERKLMLDHFLSFSRAL
jgi:hypothetical protein